MSAPVHREPYALAVDARDPRFDGVFFVGVTTTHIYCRPICPSRLAYDRHRRFFDSAAAAERAGFRPCLRCRPELAPGGGVGRVALGAVSRLAQAATQRIAAGALNDHSVADLAGELGVSERHLRRALEREIGVSPLGLAQTHRLLLAKRLLVDTDLSVTRVAYASGFQSLRRFNASFREQYGIAPRALRRKAVPPARSSASLRLTLAYRPPLAWSALLDSLRAVATPGVEAFDGSRYGRSVRIDGFTGVILAEDVPASHHIAVEVTLSLLPVLMPLIAGLRRLFDLDAEPAVVDAHLSDGGLAAEVAKTPGVRLPGALDGLEVATQLLLGGQGGLGDPIETGVPGLTHLAPRADQVTGTGVSKRCAETVAKLARAVASGGLRLEPGSDVAATRRALLALGGIGERLATLIVMRALYWPDAFYTEDRALLARAEAWRPWRAYAALHLVTRRGVGTVAATRARQVR